MGVFISMPGELKRHLNIRQLGIHFFRDDQICYYSLYSRIYLTLKVECTFLLLLIIVTD